MSVTNNFKRKTFAGQNSAPTPSSSTQIKRPKRYNNLNVYIIEFKEIYFL